MIEFLLAYVAIMVTVILIALGCMSYNQRNGYR